MLSVLSKVNSESFCRTRLKLRYRTSIQVMFLLLPNSSSYDILDIKSSVKFPHVARRRDGDNKAAREIDDIISLFTCIDENKRFNRLPVYVSNNPDAMPSARLYEGDLYGILRLLNNLNDKVNDYGAPLPFCPETCRPYKVESHL